MKLKYNITVIDNGSLFCDTHRRECLETGKVDWFDVDDTGKYRRVDVDKLEQRYKQLLRDNTIDKVLE
jgi:hypothetical protein